MALAFAGAIFIKILNNFFDQEGLSLVVLIRLIPAKKKIAPRAK